MTASPRREDLRRLRADAAAAAASGDDAQIRRIVQFADSLAARGEVDAVIEPLRQRLRLLRPPRPLSLTRLMFMPLDPLVVHPRRWLAERTGIPRPALTQLAEAARLALGETGEAVSGMIAGHVLTDTALVMAAGDALWPAASTVLAGAAAPRKWAKATGLALADFVAIARPVSAALAHGPALMRLAWHDAALATQETAAACLASAAAAGEDALATMLAALIAVWPDPGALVPIAEALAGQNGPATLLALDRAIDFTLGMVTAEGEQAEMRLPDTAAVRRAALLLAALLTPQQRRAAALHAAAQRLDQVCRAKFEATLGTILAGGGTEITMTNAARDLRQIAMAGSGLGVAGFYEGALAGAAARITAMQGVAPDVRRTVAEILLGPAQAVDAGC
jgi:hypothetical protein